MALDKYHLSLAGEYRVASELLKRNIFATITFGNAKGAVLYAIGPTRRTAIIEVKSSNSSKFVTGSNEIPDVGHSIKVEGSIG